jgi:hypothetical protein
VAQSEGPEFMSHHRKKKKKKTPLNAILFPEYAYANTFQYIWISSTVYSFIVKCFSLDIYSCWRLNARCKMTKLLVSRAARHGSGVDMCNSNTK